ncbi:urea transporter [uncultured Thiodictyon sp.]|uniref:urea transporter n=1 Tax=uncultured Thiodictyon sp. TaxID=1846217 RepID=UPI0025E437C8|nr:urea transporter [uncultured Thiodictyon sp.]
METLGLIRDFIHRLLLAYGTLFLAQGPGVGALVLGANLLDPAIGLMGLAAGLAAVGMRAWVRLLAHAGEAEILNAIYVGLVLGAFYAGTGRLVVLAVLGGALVVPLASALGPLLRQTRELPLLGAPFLCTLWTLLPAAKALGIAGRATPAPWLYPAWIERPLTSALSTLGALFYVDNPLSGVLVLAAVLLVSPVLAGFAIHTAVSARSLAVTAGAVVAATTFSVALWWVLWPIGLPPLSAPFLLAVWLVRAALRPEHGAFWSRFWLPAPATPEASASRWRLEQARGVERTSIALRPPFVGCMEVSQSMDGALTHCGPWRDALDFTDWPARGDDAGLGSRCAPHGLPHRSAVRGDRTRQRGGPGRRCLRAGLRTHPADRAGLSLARCARARLAGTERLAAGASAVASPIGPQPRESLRAAVGCRPRSLGATRPASPVGTGTCNRASACTSWRPRSVNSTGW